MRLKLPASFCGIHIHEPNSSDDITKIPGSITTKNGGFLNKISQVDNSKENDYVETPQRLDTFKMTTIRTVVEVNGNSKETTKIDTVPNNVLSSDA